MMVKKRRRKRKRVSTRWYLIKNGDIIERGDTHVELQQLQEVYKSLGNHTTLISVEEFEKAKKRQRQREREVRISNRKIQEKQNIAIKVAQQKDKERNEMNKMYNEDKLSHILRQAAMRPQDRDERRMLQIRYYKKLYPTAYSY